ncbi:MAG: LysM peptidoglycan-binding domain-containing protein [Hyphomicrobiales bacterium]
MRGALLAFAAFGLAVFAVACGGGGGDSLGGDGDRITDPARVPSSTPIQDAVLYKIENGTIAIEGGPTATVQADQTVTGGGGRQTYTVKPGDTCSAIASQFSISVDELLKANRTIDSDCGNLHEGDELVIPGAGGGTTGSGNGGAAATPTPNAGNGGRGKTYTVQAGDTCAGIAAAKGTSADQIIAANPNINAECSNLQPGDVLKLP